MLVVFKDVLDSDVALDVTPDLALDVTREDVVAALEELMLVEREEPPLLVVSVSPSHASFHSALFFSVGSTKAVVEMASVELLVSVWLLPDSGVLLQPAKIRASIHTTIAVTFTRIITTHYPNLCHLRQRARLMSLYLNRS